MQPFASLLFVILSLSVFTTAHPHVEKHKLPHNALVLQPRQAPKLASSEPPSADDQDELSTPTGWILNCPQDKTGRVCLRLSNCTKKGKVKSQIDLCNQLCDCVPGVAQTSTSGGGDGDGGASTSNAKDLGSKGHQQKPGKGAKEKYGDQARFKNRAKKFGTSGNH